MRKEESVRKTLFIALAASLFLAGALWGTGQSEKPAAAAQPQPLTRVDFQLNWRITGDHSPYYVALDQGWYKEAGLDVNVIIGQGSGYTVQTVDTGKAHLGIADAPVAITGRAKGAKVKVVGIIFDKHPNSMYFWKDSGITKPQDIVGKTVAVPAADGHKVMWPAFAKQIGVDPNSVKFVNIDPAAKASALASHNADVVFELYTGKPFMEKAIPPEQLGNLIWSDYGFNAYAHSYIASDAVLEKQPELVRKFLDVTYRAWEFVLENPEQAVEILAKYQPINKDEILANLKLVLDFFRTDRYAQNGIGYIDPARMKDTVDTVANYMNVQVTFPAEEAYSSAFLPSPMYKADF